MTRLPKDTHLLLENYNQNINNATNLWYPLNYNHYRHRKNPKLKEKLTVIDNNNVDTIGNKVEQQRLQVLVNSEIEFSVLKAQVQNNILPGLGIEHVRESALSLHHVYGIPYLPSSSIKGIVRRWFIQYFLEGKEEFFFDPPEHLKQKSMIGQMLFGGRKSKGVAQFFDVYLYDNCVINNEIITVQHSKYYAGNSEPTDQESPIPISYYSVDVKKVLIICGISPHGVVQQYSPNLLLNVLTSWVSRAMMELGVGAKTTIGFGRFSQVKDVTKEKKQSILKGIDELKDRMEQKLQEERRLQKENELKEMIAKMSPEERLIYEVSQLTSSQQDQEKSKGYIYQQVIEQNNIAAATKLSEYWKETGNWKRKEVSRKQLEKVRKLKGLFDILN